MKKKITFFEFSELKIGEKAMLTSVNGRLISKVYNGKSIKEVYRLGHFFVYAEYDKTKINEISHFLSLDGTI